MSQTEIDWIRDCLTRMETRQTDIHGRIETLSAYRIVDSQNIVTLREALDSTNRGLSALMAGGCARGADRDRRIEVLEGASTRAWGIVSAVAGIAGVIGAGLVWIVTAIVKAVKG